MLGLISIRKVTSELDRLEKLRQAAATSYGQALDASAQYAIEIDPTDAQHFRARLLALGQQVEAARDPQAWQLIQASFRGELRDYRDCQGKHLDRLRASVKSATEVLRSFVTSIASTEMDHEADMKLVVVELERLGHSGDLAEIQQGVRDAAQSLSENIAALQNQHQLALAMMRDEIRVLHEQIHFAEKAQFLDRATGIWNRQKLDQHLSELFERNQSFCLLLVCVRNLKRLDGLHSRTVIEAALKALLQRFNVLFEDGVVMGRWDEQTFGAVLQMDPTKAMGMSRLVGRKLSGGYSIQEHGVAQRVDLQIVSGLIECAAGTGGAPLLQRLVQMSEALATN